MEYNHFSKEAEQSVLGGLMLDGLAFATIERLLNPEDFYYSDHKEIYQACVDLDKKSMAMDAITVAEYLDDKNSHVTLDYIAELCDMTPGSANIEAYSEIVKEKSQRRQLDLMMANAKQLMSEGTSAQEAIDYISSEQLRIAEGKQDINQSILGTAIKNALDKLDSRFNGKTEVYTTGLEALDDIVQLEAGNLWTIAGRPSMGKSTLVQNIFEHNAKIGIPCYLFTMEMAEDEVADKILASQGGISLSVFKDPASNAKDEDWSKISAAVATSKDLPLMIDYCPSLRLSDMKNRSRAWFRKQQGYVENGKGIIAIDYLGLMKQEKDNRVQGLGEITKALKNFASEMGLPIIMLHQLNRGVEQRPDKRPVLSDLRDSGEIEEDSSIVTMVYRDEFYNEDSPDKGMAEIITRKNRGGENRTARVGAQLQYARFTNLNFNSYSGDN